MRSLIVEDDRTSRLILQMTLKEYGPTEVLENGREASAAVQAALEAGAPFDLVTLDIMMPEVDGQTALRQIREAEEAAGLGPEDGVKIVMTTALDDPKNVDAAHEGRCDGYLVKPIRRPKLLSMLKQLGLLA